MTESAPLDGLIVLDLTRFMSGPYATMTLADAGADVIKVEPVHGEETRHLNPILEDADGATVSGYFLRLNRRKRSVCLDLRTEQGRDAFLALARGADVVVENYRPGVMDRLGIGATTLLEQNPRLIFCSISGFGQTDSTHRDWPAFNLVPEAMAGVLSQLPIDGQPPRTAGPAVGDLFPALHAVTGILLALLRRATTGKGSVIDIAMYDSMLSFNEMGVASAAMTGQDFMYGVTVNPNLAPYGYFPAQDGWVCIAVGPDRQWQSLANVMDVPELGTDDRLATGTGRAKHFKELIEPVLLPWLSTRGKEEIAGVLAAAGIPTAPVRVASEALVCEQAAGRNMIQDVIAPAGATWKIAGNPVRMTPPVELGAPSTVVAGANTVDVLVDIGGMDTSAAATFAPDARLISATDPNS